MLNRLIFLYARRATPGLRRLVRTGFYAWLDARNRWRHGTADMFSTVQIETSSLCNRRCPYCPNADDGVRREERWLEEDVIERVLRELRALRFDGVVVFSGYNEPLADPRLPRIVARTRSWLPACRIVVYTNGDRLDAAWLDRADRLALDINVTLHGGAADAARVAALLRAAPRRQRRRVTVKRDITATALSTRGGLVSVPVVQARPICHVPLSELTIMSDGEVVLCSDDYRSTVSFGNVRGLPLHLIWASGRYRRLREDLRRGVFTEPLCAHCRGGGDEPVGRA